MQFKKTLMAVALAGLGFGAQAAPVAIDSLFATNGSFNLGGVPGAPASWAFTQPTFNLTSGYAAFGSAFTFFGAPVNMYTSDGTTTPFGGAAVPGGPVISGTVDAATNSISVNLSSWTAAWNGTNFNQGASPVTGTWDPTTHAFSISWLSTVVGGPFNGQTGAWSLTGTAIAAAVPEPATYGMLLAGLGLLGFMVSRRRKML